MMRKHPLKTLGFSLLTALSLMAFSASSAQAGEIQVGGSTALATGTTASGAQIGVGQLLVPALSIEIDCGTSNVVGKITSGALGTAEIELAISNCLVYPINAKKELTSATPLPCTLLEPIVAKGPGEVVLHGGRSYLLAKSPAGAPFTTLHFVGAECTLPLFVQITGSQAIKVLTGDLNVGAAVVEPEFEAADAIQELLGDQLLFGKNPAFLMGKAKVKISAPAIDIGRTIGLK